MTKGFVFANYASTSSKGRLLDEQARDTGPFQRSDFQRDRDRILHSGAFRRLKHKTQVFVYHEGDYYRTRLTHSIEVAQIARSMARALGFNEDLAEAIALAHDLGHTPFGHAGEEALDQVMQPYGGFDHNEQTLRVLTRLEERYAGFDGLNLTWETLEGVAKHNGPVAIENRRPTLLLLDEALDLKLDSYASGEAQLANLADDIAYLAHDVDDSLRAGLFVPADIAHLPVISAILADLNSRFHDLPLSRLSHELTRHLISYFVQDLLGQSHENLQGLAPETPDAIRHAGYPVIAHSQAAREELRALRQFLFTNMWRHYKVNRMTSKAKRVTKRLFNQLMDETNLLPTEWQRKLTDEMTGKDALNQQARIIADYVASMTDRYALLEYERLFETGPILS